MKLHQPSLAVAFGLASAASATAGGFEPAQQVLGGPVQDMAAAAPPQSARGGWRDFIKDLPSQAKALWEEVDLLMPHSLDDLQFVSSPKPHRRRPDEQWDHIVRGAEVQSMRAAAGAGGKLDSQLGTYDLRVRKVDPAKLEVDTVKQYSGYLDDHDNDKHLFYWFFESRNDPKNDPVVLWLNGGPGCSSLTGLFLELGPSFITREIKLERNEFAWNSNASVIFLDQPVNVGFSYSGSSSVKDTKTASKDIYALLTLFFEQFPEYARQDFHIAGESYAGHYIPIFAAEILEHPSRNINLKSVLIGNGLTDGFTQYAHYRPMGCGEGGYPARLSPSECESMDRALPRCQSLIKSCYESESVWNCVPAAIYCNNAMFAAYQRTGYNVYDIRSRCEDTEGLCYPALRWTAEYLNQRHVMDALGAEVDGYDSCNMNMNRDFLFAGDWMKPFHRVVPTLLDEMPVLVYAGDADYICNWLGNQAWTEELEWRGQAEFNRADVKSLVVGNASQDAVAEYGKVKSSGNLTFMRIYGAGHMVPMDQPANALDMFNRWLGGEWGG